jgi:hypothetical protein
MSGEVEGSYVTKECVLESVKCLMRMHQAGLLGGAQMPEDANPGLERGSAENFLYFTLPMALNYQRNSYALWRSALQTYQDPETRFVFDPACVVQRRFEELQAALTRYKLALQPNKQPQTWMKLCASFNLYAGGDVRVLLERCGWSIPCVLDFVTRQHKADFPYLSGTKISHYWLYVLCQYTSAPLSGKEQLSVAPDTHVIQATIQLGLVAETQRNAADIQQQVSEAWAALLKDSGICPIEVHTPLWLWSRGGWLKIRPTEYQPPV